MSEIRMWKEGEKKLGLRYVCWWTPFPDLFISIQIKFKTAGKRKYHTSKQRSLQQHAPLKEFVAQGAAALSAQTEVFAQWELNKKSENAL